MGAMAGRELTRLTVLPAVSIANRTSESPLTLGLNRQPPDMSAEFPCSSLARILHVC